MMLHTDRFMLNDQFKKPFTSCYNFFPKELSKNRALKSLNVSSPHHLRPHLSWNENPNVIAPLNWRSLVHSACIIALKFICVPKYPLHIHRTIQPVVGDIIITAPHTSAFEHPYHISSCNSPPSSRSLSVLPELPSALPHLRMTFWVLSRMHFILIDLLQALTFSSLQLLPQQLQDRLVDDGKLLLTLGPGDLVTIAKGLGRRQIGLSGPIGDDIACAAGCIPMSNANN